MDYDYGPNMDVSLYLALIFRPFQIKKCKVKMVNFQERQQPKLDFVSSLHNTFDLKVLQ